MGQWDQIIEPGKQAERAIVVRESATSSPSRSSEPCRTESLESLPRGLVRPRGLIIRVIRTRRSLETFARHLHAFFAMRNWLPHN